MHNAKTFKIRDYEITDEKLIIITDGDTIRLVLDKALPFLNECLTVDGKETIKKEKRFNGDLQLYDRNTTQKLRDTLIENIDRVKENPNYIKQAHAINSSVNTLINLVKTEIMARKIIEKNENN